MLQGASSDDSSDSKVMRMREITSKAKMLKKFPGSFCHKKDRGWEVVILIGHDDSHERHPITMEFGSSTPQGAWKQAAVSHSKFWRQRRV